MKMNEKLRTLQLTQLEILKVFDKICKDHGLRYSLYAGTLLGAVRHGGFIPWDDDLDVCMPRADYDRFISLWEKVKPEGYILQNKELEPAFTQSFTKIRKDHTTFLQEKWEAGRYHTGIFIDIFPIDRMPEGKLPRLLFRWNCMLYQLYTREFAPNQYGKAVQLGTSLLLKLTPEHKRPALRRKLLAKITKFGDSSNLNAATVETISAMKIQYLPQMPVRYITIPFEDGHFLSFEDWDDHLRRKFGNYMELPPEEERTWKHHPIIIDFEHNYEELE